MADKEIGKIPKTPAADSTADLYADADLSKRQKGAGTVKIDVEGTYGSEADFLKSAPLEMRTQLGLKSDASSDDVYHKMARDMVAMFPKASAMLQREALESLGLQRGQVNEANVYNAFIARDRRETNTPASASLADLEQAVHRRTYKMMKDGTIPIDYD